LTQTYLYVSRIESVAMSPFQDELEREHRKAAKVEEKSLAKESRRRAHKNGEPIPLRPLKKDKEE